MSRWKLLVSCANASAAEAAASNTISETKAEVSESNGLGLVVKGCEPETTCLTCHDHVDVHPNGDNQPRLRLKRAF